MKPFDLEAAKRGEPIQTRDGRKARFIAYVPECDPGWRVLAKLDEYRNATGYHENGKYIDPRESDEDLFMATRTHELWVAMNDRGVVVERFFSRDDLEVYLNNTGNVYFPGKLTWES